MTSTVAFVVVVGVVKDAVALASFVPSGDVTSTELTTGPAGAVSPRSQ
jgi:hypothetical protein